MASAQEVLDICESLEVLDIDESMYLEDLISVKSKEIFKKFLASVTKQYRVVRRKDVAGRAVYTSPTVPGIVGRIDDVKNLIEVNKHLLQELQAA